MLFFNRSKKRSVELLQLHQYLALLDGGMEAHEASAVEKVAALAIARDVWQLLALGVWDEIDPARVDAWRNKVHGQRFVHIPTAIEDCFLVVVFEESPAPASYFLFDIGSQYTPPILFCPAFGLEQTATEIDIRFRNCLPAWNRSSYWSCAAGPTCRCTRTGRAFVWSINS